jgi:hypothetical protein
MDPVEQFYRNAERLEALAERVSEPETERQCLALARLWRQLASFVERELGPGEGPFSA